MGSRVANGRLSQGCSGLAAATNLFSTGLSVDTIYTLTFEAYADSTSPASHNSAVGFHSDDCSATGWWVMADAGNSWMFLPYPLYPDPAPREYFGGGYDKIVTLTTIIDPINLEIYGIIDFGGGVTIKTKHWPIDLNQFLKIDGVSVLQQYSPYLGAEFDNIMVTAAPIPEPSLRLDLEKFKIKYYKETGETVIKMHGTSISELAPVGETIDAKITVEIDDIVFMSDEVAMTVEDRPNVILIEK